MLRRPVILFLGYIVLSLLLGDVYPFSRYDMYAQLGRRTQGAVPVLWADGKIADARDYERFTGIAAEQFKPPQRLGASPEFLWHDIRTWLANNQGSEQGPVRIEVGFQLVSVRHERVEHSRLIQQTGTAWPRR